MNGYCSEINKTIYYQEESYLKRYNDRLFCKICNNFHNSKEEYQNKLNKINIYNLKKQAYLGFNIE